MELVNTLLALLKEFRDVVFRPLILFLFGAISLSFLIMPESLLTRLDLANLVQQYRAWVFIITIVLFAFGFIRTMDAYYFPWRKQRKQRERDKESFQRQLVTLSKYELLILAYCLSRNHITFFVLDQGRNAFEDAVRTLTTRGIFKQGPLAIQGYSYDITDDYWKLLQHFKEEIQKKTKAINPDWEQKFQFYDGYQKQYGFEQVGTPVNYTAYTKDVFLDVVWKWEYSAESGHMPQNLIPHCPKCDLQLKQELAVYSGDTPSHHQMICSIHRSKDYYISVDGQGNYAKIIADIMNNIQSGKWKEIIDR